MGKKRNRIPGFQRTGSVASVPAAQTNQHSQSLAEDVLEQRDPQFATEKRETDRAKRRRLATASETAVDATAVLPSKPAVDARKAGLEMWRRAARRERNKAAHVDGRDAEDDGSDERPSDGRLGAKIVEQARQQRADLRVESEAEAAAAAADGRAAEEKAVSATDAMYDALAGSDSDASDDDARSAAATDWRSLAGDDDRDLDFLDGSKITEEEELALSLFARDSAPAVGFAGAGGAAKDNGEQEENEQHDGQPRIMLADIILEKIREKEEADARTAELAKNPEKVARERKIAEVYALVGNIMSRYRSGKVPKAFKVIPKLPNWEELLYMTRPDSWSTSSFYVATRLLASNLKAKQVVPFYSDVLLPRCLDDIAENKKLNYHLYRALAKAVYKPDAFCKGIIFPLCEDPRVSLRQATIIASVVRKVSIPMLHSAVALLNVSKMPFRPTTCLVMNALIDKRYALPYRVVDSIVDGFLRACDDPRSMPLVWHKCLLSFAQRYRMELTVEQKEKLKALMRAQTHPAITAEIRRELFSARNRGDEMDPDANTIARNIAKATMVAE